MTEPTIAGVVGQIAAPVVSALLEELHQTASAEITRLEATMPARIEAAEQTVQDWTSDLIGAYHRLVAHIDSARSNVTAATNPGPTAADTATSSATSTAPTTTGPQDATSKATK
jgi:hypothetical protein